MSSTNSNKSTVDSPVAIAQVMKIGDGQALINGLNQHIRRTERGQIMLPEAITLSESCDAMLEKIFGTPRMLVFEKKIDENTGKEFAPEFNKVKAALNTLRLRLSQAYPTQIPARATKSAAVAAIHGF